MTTKHSDNPHQSPSPEPDRVFEIVQKMVPYLFGSVWWGRDDLIHTVQPQFRERDDRIGHPLLSTKREKLASRYDEIPMLVGTSGQNLREAIRNECVSVRGLTSDEPERITYFGSIITPGSYGFDDLLDGVSHKAQAFRRPAKPQRDAVIVASETIPWHELRTMHPNEDKPRLNESEMADLESFCKEHNF